LKVLIVGPHPDDELLGCGGTLLRYKAEGAELGWLIVTGISEETGWTATQVKLRETEIEQVQIGLGVDQLYNLRLPSTRLDTLPIADLIGQFSEVFREFQPEEIFVPHPADVHTDHRITFDAVAACSKWFRYPSIRRVLAYETLSETEFGLDQQNPFQPNVFVNISEYLERKVKLLKIYQSELEKFPFPRSEEAIRALAHLRGSQSGFKAAESFVMLRELK